MSVPTYRRTLSATEYVWNIRQLAVRVGEIVNNKPKKYKNTYADKIIALSLDALSEVVMANDIYVKTEKDYENRRSHLLKADGLLDSLVIISDIFLEQIKKSPVDPSVENKSKRNSKIEKQQIELGDKVDICKKLIKGVVKSDAERYKKRCKES